MFEVAVEHSFAAGHALRGYKGKCENVHGHNYKVRVAVSGEKLDSIGLLMDFVELRSAIRALVEGLDHRFLNEVAPFDRLNPSAENLARYFCEGLAPQIQSDGLRIAAVTVWETDNASATFRPAGAP